MKQITLGQLFDLEWLLRAPKDLIWEQTDVSLEIGVSRGETRESRWGDPGGLRPVLSYKIPAGGSNPTSHNRWIGSTFFFFLFWGQFTNRSLLFLSFKTFHNHETCFLSRCFIHLRGLCRRWKTRRWTAQNLQTSHSRWCASW